MSLFFQKHKAFLFLCLLVVISELIVNPLGNFPLNDDWAFGKASLNLLKTGKINIGDVPAMTLWTQLIWSHIFVKVFGFSFTVLRFSTLIASLIGLWFLYKLTVKISSSAIVALVIGLTFYFNPIYFSLTNTYMTDVSFQTLFVICVYYAFRFFETGNVFPFVMVFIMSTLLVLVRQFGIIVPLCFTVACLLNTPRKWIYFACSVLGTIGVFLVFKYYEDYLRSVLLPNSAYIFSGAFKVTSAEFWKMFYTKLELRYGQILIHTLVYSFPFVAVIIGSQLKAVSAKTGILMAFISFVLVLTFLKGFPFPMGNMLQNMHMGPDTFYENLHPYFQNKISHTYSEGFDIICTFIKYLFGAGALLSLLLHLFHLLQKKRFDVAFNPFVLFCLALFALYTFLIVVSDNYFDRYHLPLLGLALIFFTYAGKEKQVDLKPAIVPLAIFFYVAVLGTKDYIELNRQRWGAYHHLKDTLNVPRAKINGGYEVNCWYEGDYTPFYLFLDLPNYDYLIQYRHENDFKVMKSYQFQRYFPYKKDTVFIFEREK